MKRACYDEMVQIFAKHSRPDISSDIDAELANYKVMMLF